jgi:hypothetical protein
VEPLEPIEEAAATRSRVRMAGIAVAVVTAVALIALVVAQSGDGKAEDGDPIRSAQSGAQPGVPETTTSTIVVGTAPPTTTAAPGSAGASTTTTPTVPPSPGDYPYKVTLSASCASPGQDLTVVLHLAPEALGSLVARYSDNQSHGTHHAGSAGSDGTLTHTFKVAPTLGQGTILTSARSSDGRSGTTSVPFKVAPAGGC